MIEQALSNAVMEAASGDIVDSTLETVRRHLNMDLAYLSEVVGDDILFRAVAAKSADGPDRLGASRKFGTMYCHHIAEGRLPKLIRDTRHEPVALEMPITRELGIGSHVSVPIYRNDGSMFGMFCCLSPDPNPTLNDRDLSVMELFATLSEQQVNAGLSKRREKAAAMERITGALAGGFHMVFQPIFDIRTGAVSGFESLCRFDGAPYRSPDIWFAEASLLGLGTALEGKVIRAALVQLQELPAHMYVSVNASPDAVLDGTLASALEGAPLERVILEVTEHAAVADYATLIAALAPLRDRGLRLAIDDAGAGYSGLQHILRLTPDIIKLDMSLTREIDTDFARRSLAQALVTFAGRTRSELVAEGIETEAERHALRELGIGYGQGYLLSRPLAPGAANALALQQAQIKRSA